MLQAGQTIQALCLIATIGLDLYEYGQDSMIERMLPLWLRD